MCWGGVGEVLGRCGDLFLAGWLACWLAVEERSREETVLGEVGGWMW